ncbi:hypothetical protein BEP19_04495 [Ammoniphilus oxalaticus]|uniref:Uncharacterized protein n=1 Tax=Ammoniphilus oxalaticus TaxID=66863 RepID=A0A419SM44_9BACL|nr:hypothetical protein [Ammoniphilus oxalaticus]RKD25085.1 hypothetical protein BEP19_04495 [Ammoniphilus oxalaticus]
MDNKKKAKQLDPQLRDIGTRSAGATRLHETRTADTPEKIEAPVVPHPGPYDTRTGKYTV